MSPGEFPDLTMTRARPCQACLSAIDPEGKRVFRLGVPRPTRIPQFNSDVTQVLPVGLYAIPVGDDGNLRDVLCGFQKR
jgi:hypothetical protein